MTEQNGAGYPVFTVGHSNGTVEAFVALLAQHGIEAVADVRSTPYSEYCAQFNREAIKEMLRAAGIQYFFVGDALGARREEASCYKNGVAEYGLIAQAASFRRGLDRAEERAREMRIALMCSEKDPLQCHRFLLISRCLKERGVVVAHILEDGSLESQEEAEKRLLRELKMLEMDLFRSEEEVLDEAYARQSAKYAYRKNNLKAG